MIWKSLQYLVLLQSWKRIKVKFTLENLPSNFLPPVPAVSCGAVIENITVTSRIASRDPADITFIQITAIYRRSVTHFITFYYAVSAYRRNFFVGRKSDVVSVRCVGVSVVRVVFPQIALVT